MKDTQISIQEADMKDTLAELISELGYRTTMDEMKERIANIQNHEDYKTYVALPGTRVVGR